VVKRWRVKEAAEQRSPAGRGVAVADLPRVQCSAVVQSWPPRSSRWSRRYCRRARAAPPSPSCISIVSLVVTTMPAGRASWGPSPRGPRTGEGGELRRSCCHPPSLAGRSRPCYFSKYFTKFFRFSIISNLMVNTWSTKYNKINN
jgi:hypothetical protein